MHDNSSIHSSKASSAYVSRTFPKVLNWPARSPDLNPIENVWGYLTQGWTDMEHRNINLLREIMTTKWEELRQKPGMIARYYR